jgi:protein gp37
MADSKIEWTERSDWNPIRGCTRVSPGCGGPGDAGGCYAEAIAARFSGPGQPFEGYATRTAKGPRWTGKVEVMWDRIDLPLRWRQPALIFASSTSDFFHKDLAGHDIAQLFGVMIAAHHLRGHTFQVLTKRADIMRMHLNTPEFWEAANAAAESHIMERVDPLNRRSDDARATCDDYGPENPPPGIWLGVSVEDQTRADERIPDVLATPAAVRFLSCEPLLGPIDLTNITKTNGPGVDVFDALQFDAEHGEQDTDLGTAVINWVIAGGESGPNARPMHPDWARSLRDQCAETGTPFHFKQWGEWAPGENCPHVQTRTETGATWFNDQWSFEDITPHMSEELHTDDAPDVWRIGKKRAGRLLDGVEHNGMPA